mgnify:CR=1 FL=1
MNLNVNQNDASCGAIVEGIDLTASLKNSDVKALRRAWLENHVLVFPDQLLSDDDLERFSLYFGCFGNDPFIAPIDGRDHVIAVGRKAEEKAPVFAEVWHSDWSFQKIPPAGTCLYSIKIPPVGGDTEYINQHKALKAMSSKLRSQIEGKEAIHSARAGYSPEGYFGDQRQEADRSMRIVVSESAKDTQTHPIIKRHPETGMEALFGCLGYIIGIKGMPDDESRELLFEVYKWQTQEEFIYTHQWQEHMLVMWDNRSLLHKANGGYDGHERLLHRTTIADQTTA